MKKIIALALAAVMAFSMVACGEGTGEDKENLNEVVVQYDLGLAENGFYKDIVASEKVILPENIEAIEISAEDIAVDESEVDKFINNLKETYGTQVDVENKAAAMGDYVTIGFVGTIDGKEFEGGSVAETNLRLGSNALIDGFEDQICGHNKSESFNVKVTFPEGYGDTVDSEGNPLTLDGKEAVFKVELKHIYQLRLTDADIIDAFGDVNLTVDGEHVTNLEEAKQYCRDWHEVVNKENAVVAYVLENSVFDEECLENIKANRRTVEEQVAKKQAAANGFVEVESFLALYGFETMDEYIAACEEDIDYTSRYLLASQAVLEKLDIEVTYEDIKDIYGDQADTVIQDYGKAYVMQQIVPTKAVGSLVELAVVK